jgi:hypothetical protein
MHKWYRFLELLGKMALETLCNYFFFVVLKDCVHYTVIFL